MIKKITLLVLVMMSTAFGLVAFAPQASAVDVISRACNNPRAVEVPAACVDNQSNKNPLFGPDGLITKIVQLLAIIIGIAAVVTIMLAGLRLIISNGDPQAVTTARNAILYAVVGLIVAALAQTMVTFVLNRVGV